MKKTNEKPKVAVYLAGDSTAADCPPHEAPMASCSRCILQARPKSSIWRKAGQAPTASSQRGVLMTSPAGWRKGIMY